MDSKENKRVGFSEAGVKRELLDTVKARKLAYYGHTVRKQGSCLEKEIMQGTMPGARRRGMPRTAWMDNIKTRTGFSAEESVRTTEDRDKKVRPWCGQPSDRGRLKNRTERWLQWILAVNKLYCNTNRHKRTMKIPAIRPTSCRQALEPQRAPVKLQQKHSQNKTRNGI